MQQLPLSKTAVWISYSAVYTGPVAASVCDTANHMSNPNQAIGIFNVICMFSYKVRLRLETYGLHNDSSLHS